ncbi:MAG: hypothetical protein O6927_07430, partial [Gammaproteobacteria bacterium]|nr:hypothetical protein [Gammaproteobacteria bacterium]
PSRSSTDSRDSIHSWVSCGSRSNSFAMGYSLWFILQRISELLCTTRQRGFRSFSESLQLK